MKFCEIFNSLLCAKQDHNSLYLMSDECGEITEQVKSTKQENNNMAISSLVLMMKRCDCVCVWDDENFIEEEI